MGNNNSSGSQPGTPVKDQTAASSDPSRAAPSVEAQRHDISVAIMVGILFPGTGQFYNGQTGKGIVLMVPGLIGMVFLAINMRRFHISLPLAALILTLWLFGIIEAAWIAARLKRGETVRPWKWF